MTRLDDPALVRAEYASDSGLAGRIAAQHRFGKGPDARGLTFRAVAEAAPRTVLEVGCGQGWLSERIQRELGCAVVALDQSEHMVELTRRRGIEALVGDVQALPFADATFDCAVAAWMLYHVADLDRSLAELARVLVPGGRLVAVTNGADHLRELAGLLGAERSPHAFASEDAEADLQHHFRSVERRDASGWLSFPSRAEAQEFVDHTVVWRGRRLPPFEGPLRVRRSPAVFVASK